MSLSDDDEFFDKHRASVAGGVINAPDEMGDLYIVIDQQKEEINRLREALTSEAGDIEKKYLDALRKVKATNVKYETERARVQKLTQQLVDADARFRASERLNHAVLPSARAASHAGDDGASELTSMTDGDTAGSGKKLRERLEQVQKSNAEYKRNNTTMRQELAKLKEVVKREVGDANINDDGWRGRAQTISLLKGKVKELQRQLAQVNGEDGPIAPSDSASCAVGGYAPSTAAMTSATSPHGGRRDFDDVNRDRLTQVSTARKANDLKVLQKLTEVERERDALKEKLSAHTARTAVLENEQGNLKIQLQRVLQKTDNDDQLLTAYKTELADAKKTVARLHQDMKLNTELLQREKKAAAAAVAMANGDKPNRPSSNPGSRRTPSRGERTPPSPTPADDLAANTIPELRARVKDLEGMVFELQEEICKAVEEEEQYTKTPRGSAVDVAGTERAAVVASVISRLIDYTLLLRRQLHQHRRYTDGLEEQLFVLKAKDPSHSIAHTKAVPFDPSTLPAQVVQQLDLLKAEASSLRQRTSMTKDNQEAELTIWRNTLDDYKRLVAARAGRRGSRPSSAMSSMSDDGVEHFQKLQLEKQVAALDSENADLKRQYQKLKAAYNDAINGGGDE
eukprot:TRINITY_DN16704_c0_g1_i1.p1 TRINITY_DN16704_c0_g1~~TRINITY_DN16704_c0_g1_i1.p1  ORF type:complete len:626 (+),score=255.93 TRINITY_DN16704_c0_g1_i1:136-2013(+)